MSSQGPSSFDQQVEAHFRAMEPKASSNAEVSPFDEATRAFFAECQPAAQTTKPLSVWDRVVAAELPEALDLSSVEPSGLC
eukprot:1597011-Rhodomonas_salina.1